MYKKSEKHSFKIFSENLKNGNIARVLLMYGIEQYLVKWAVESLVKTYVNPATVSMDYVQMDGENVQCEQIVQTCETFSMFSQRRIVWVRDFKGLNSDNVKGWGKRDLEELAEYVASSNESAVLIFSAEEVKSSAILTSALKKNAQCYEFDRIDKGELTSFARKRFRAAGLEIGPAALSKLIDATGYYNRESDYRLFHFENDIQKVIAHSDGVRITEEDIARSVSGDLETFVFDMLEAVTANKKDRAFQILYNMLHSGGDAFSVIGAMVSQFEMLLSVRQLREDGMDLSAIQKKLGGSAYRIRKLIPYANKYTAVKLKEILSSVYEADRNIKTGLVDSQTALELVIAGV